jgi:hypothetical protein
VHRLDLLDELRQRRLFTERPAISHAPRSFLSQLLSQCRSSRPALASGIRRTYSRSTV